MIMAVRKVARDLLFSKNPLLRQQVPRLQLVPPYVDLVRREFSVFNDFSKKIKVGETKRNPELQQGFKGVKEDLKEVRMNQTTEQLYKHVDGVWTEAEAKAKKFKDGFGMGKPEEFRLSKSFCEEKQSPLSNKWEAFKNEMRSYRESVLKRVIQSAANWCRPIMRDYPRGHRPGYSVLGDPEMTMLYAEMQRKDPNFSHPQFFVLREVQKVVKQVLTDHFKIAEEDMRKITHHPGIILDKIVFGEPDLTKLFRKMYPKNNRRAFSLPEFHREVEKVVKPVLNAHIKKQGVDAIRVGEDHQILKGQATMNQSLKNRDVMT